MPDLGTPAINQIIIGLIVLSITGTLFVQWWRIRHLAPLSVKILSACLFLTGGVSFVWLPFVAPAYPVHLVFPMSSSPEQIEVAWNGDIFVASLDRIQRFSTDGEFVTAFVPSSAGGVFRFVLDGENLKTYSVRCDCEETFSLDGQLLDTKLVADDEMPVNFFGSPELPATNGEIEARPRYLLGNLKIINRRTGKVVTSPMSLWPPFLALPPFWAWVFLGAGYLLTRPFRPKKPRKKSWHFQWK